MDRSKVEETVQKAIHRLPIIEKARIAGGWAGLRPLTPDDHAIIGWAPGVEGFFLAVGFGGHGFQHSPATGRYVANGYRRQALHGPVPLRPGAVRGGAAPPTTRVPTRSSTDSAKGPSRLFAHSGSSPAGQ